MGTCESSCFATTLKISAMRRKGFISFFSAHRTVLPLVAMWLFCQSVAHAQSAMFELLGHFGGKGTQVGQFAAPRGLVADGQGNIIISDTQNHRIQICDYSGNCSAFGSQGSAPGQFSWPWGIALDSKGRIVVADRMNHRVQICNYQGNCTAFGSQGRNPGQFDEPMGLEVGSQDRIIVGDSDNDRYQVCNDQGNCTAHEDAYQLFPGITFIPVGISVDSSDRIVIADSRWDLVVICNYQGACSTTIGGGQEQGFPGAFGGLEDTAIDSQDRIFTVGTSGVQVCDDQGECFVYSESFPLDGDYPFTRFSHSEGIAVDQQDRILIADSGNGMIMVLRFLGTAIKFPVNAAISDAWYNSVTQGQGFMIQIFPESRQIFLAWFTFDTQLPDSSVAGQIGDPGHRWLTAYGPYRTNEAELFIELTQGGVFDSSSPRPEQTIDDGSMLLEFSDCRNGTITYDIRQGSVAGVVPIKRVDDDNVPLCEELAPLTPLR